MPGFALQVAALRLAFGPEAGIDIADIGVAPGSVCAISGPSGSGKSTLLYLLSGLLRADAGSILWDRDEFGGMPEGVRDRWRRHHAGFIFQDFHLFDEMTPLQNVVLPAWFDGFSSRRFQSRAERLLADLGVPAGRKRTALLSRGEQQRVAIARALVATPRVIFADEPTASLDVASSKAVAGILRQASVETGCTVIVATHDPLLRQAADQVIWLEHGRLAEAPRDAAA